VNPSINVEAEWAPAYELVSSLCVFAQRQHHGEIELGPGWARAVRQKVPASFVREVAGLYDCDKENKRAGDFLISLVRQAPGDREADSFLSWLAERPTGELYERLAPTIPVGEPPLPRDLGAQRDRWVALLTLWNERYFAALDPAILSGLAADAAEKRALLGELPPLEAVERATNGMLLEFGRSRPAVTLVPHYHDSPLNSVTIEHERLIILYPADVVPPPPGAPTRPLLRLLRGLSDESRLRMLRMLVDDSCTLTEIARGVGLSQSTVHHHLLLLRAGGLVRIHFGEAGTKRYSLRPHALEQLGTQLGSFLQPTTARARTRVAKGGRP
jgi:DNA-binding transcriptional ArsR family regulator